MSHHDEIRAMHNHICIAGGMTVGRLIGVHRDGMDSYYHLRLRDRDVRPGRSRDVHMTMVTACASLAGIEAYDMLESEFTRDGCPPEPEFLDTTATRAEDIANYGHSSVDNGFGYDDRIVISPEHGGFGTAARMHQWLLIRRAGFEDDTIIRIEEHDEHGGVILDAPADGDWDALIMTRIKAGMLRMSGR